MQGAIAIFTVNLKKNSQINVENAICSGILKKQPVKAKNKLIQPTIKTVAKKKNG